MVLAVRLRPLVVLVQRTKEMRAAPEKTIQTVREAAVVVPEQLVEMLLPRTAATVGRANNGLSTALPVAVVAAVMGIRDDPLARVVPVVAVTEAHPVALPPSTSEREAEAETPIMRAATAARVSYCFVTQIHAPLPSARA